MLFLTASGARAESFPASIRGDEVSYDYETKQIEVTHHVVITYKDLKVEADQAWIDQEESILLAEGNVTATKKDNHFQGNRLIYYLKADQGWMEPVMAVITENNEDMKGKAFISAAEALLKGEAIQVKKGSFTSCDRDHPHYHFTAEFVEYYPDDRVVFHKMWYWEGKMRLFYLPYLVIGLKKDSDNFEVQAGYNETEGWFLYVAYNYFINNRSHGKVYTRLTEEAGDGIGVKHTIEPTPTSKWYQDYFVRDLHDEGIPYREYKYAYGYENWTDLKQKYRVNLENWHRYTRFGDQYLENSFHFNFDGTNPYPSGYFYYDDKGYTSNDLLYDLNRVLDLGLTGNYNPSNTFTNQYRIRWGFQENLLYDNPSSFYEYNIISHKNWGWSNITGTVYEMKPVQGNLVASYYYRPDIKYEIPKWNAPLLGDVKIAAQYTEMGYNSGVNTPIQSGERLGMDATKNIKLWESIDHQLVINSLTTGSYRSFAINGTPSDLGALSTDIGATDRLTKHLTTEARLGYKEVEGQPNSFFSRLYNDNIQPGGFLYNRWSYNRNRFNASAYSQYYFTTETTDPLYANVSWNPSAQEQFALNTVYYWGQGLGATSLQVNYTPKANWIIAAYLSYNFLYDQWDTINFHARIKEKLSEKWECELETYYDPLRNIFSTGWVNFTYNWHCRDVIFHFDNVAKLFWVQLRVKAFPKVSISSNDDPMQLLFGQ